MTITTIMTMMKQEYTTHYHHLQYLSLFYYCVCLVSLVQLLPWSLPTLVTLFKREMKEFLLLDWHLRKFVCCCVVSIFFVFLMFSLITTCETGTKSAGDFWAKKSGALFGPHSNTHHTTSAHTTEPSTLKFDILSNANAFT